MKVFEKEKFQTLTVFILFSILLYAPNIAFAGEISLPDFLQLVKENNNTLRSSVSSLESTYYAVRAAVAPQRPSLGVQGSTNTVTSQATENTLSAGLTGRIDISGTYGPQEKSAILGYRIQAERHADLVNSILGAAEEVFWRASMARENILLNEKILAERAENLRVTREKYKQDLIPRLDVIRAEARVEESRSLLTQARADYKDLLARMVSLSGGSDMEPLYTSLEVGEYPTRIDFEETCQMRPDIQALELALERSKVDRLLASKGLAPTLDAFMGWTIATDGDFVTPPDNELLLSLTLNVPVTDGKETRNRVSEKEEIIRASEQELLARKDEALAEITQAHNRLEKALALKATKEKEVLLADEELRITTLLYQEGLGSQLDLLNAQTDQARASTERLDAMKELYLAVVDIKKACGNYATEYTDRQNFRY
ncbi:MAG: TolC family protein [Synergistales bacterium]|nr:TolC family protein [Synergistales bacterium]